MVNIKRKNPPETHEGRRFRESCAASCANFSASNIERLIRPIKHGKIHRTPPPSVVPSRCHSASAPGRPAVANQAYRETRLRSRAPARRSGTGAASGVEFGVSETLELSSFSLGEWSKPARRHPWFDLLVGCTIFATVVKFTESNALNIYHN